ncbi:MAG: DUF5719 family protein [Actinomycetota bacterium]|nr:DUF5719 family protein [Actinomycetota bacterium]
MRKTLIILLAALLCLAMGATLAAAEPAEDASFQADAVSAASPNYRTFTEADLKSMLKYTQTLDGGGDIVAITQELAGGHYTCQKNSDPYTYFEQDWKGVDLSYLLDVEVGIKADTTAIKVIAEDGYSVTLTLDEMRGNSNPRGLPTLLGYKYGEESANNPNAPDPTGAPWVAPKPTDNELTVDDGGPFRLIMPQKVEGPDPRNAAYSPAGTGDPNWQKSVKWVRAIEVQPTATGVPAIDPESIPDNQVIVYGNILNRRTYTVDQLKSINPTTATYHWKNKGGFEGDATFTGIPLGFFLDEVIGLQDTATDVQNFAADGWGFKDTWTLDEVRQTCPDGNKMMLAWNEDGEDLGPEPDGSGPIEFIKPQDDPSDTNTSKWLKWTREVNVLPMGNDPGVDETRIPTDRIIVCGAIDANNIPNEWYFAEGSTGYGYETFMCIANPNSWESHVIIDYYIEGEGPQQQELDVAPHSRTTVNVNSVLGEGKNVSTRVEGYHGDSIVAERAMYWNDKVGGHCASGVNAPAKEWYLAEGCTAGGYETWILLQNPGDEVAYANITYMTGDQETVGPELALPPNSRLNVNVGWDVADNWQVSTVVDSSKPIVVERAMYWNDKTAGHCASGVTGPSNQWYLAEGTTGSGFETFVLVQNPNDDAVTVDLTAMTSEGPSLIVDDWDMAGNSRNTFRLNDYVENNDNVSTKVTSSGDVIAERAVYWNNKEGGHDAHGLMYPKFESFLAEGATAGGFDTWVLVQNPSTENATVNITYMTAEGPVQKDPLTVLAGQRVSVNIGADIGETYNVSTQVTSNVAVAVERSVYWNNKIGGTCSTGYAAW